MMDWALTFCCKPSLWMEGLCCAQPKKQSPSGRWNNRTYAGQSSGRTAMLDIADRTARIRELNDAFRSTLRGGRVMLTSGFNALPEMVKSQVIDRIKTFTEFDSGNDPYHEHDFVSLEVAGQRFFAKIEYYDRDLRFGADDPSDPERTTRIMTVMLAEEY
jgi:hypothetical protein